MSRIVRAEHAGLGVVDQQEIPIPDRGQEFLTEILDPEVHGVAAGQLQVLHLRAHLALQTGLNVAQQQVRRGKIARRQFGLKIGEHVQLRSERLAVVHIGGVLAGPEEGLAGDTLQTLQVDAVFQQQIRVLLGKVIPHHGDQPGRGKVTCRERNIGGRAAQHAVHPSMRRFHAVVSYRANNHKRHCFIVSERRQRSQLPHCLYCRLYWVQAVYGI
jgi:hypothetical protein